MVRRNISMLTLVLRDFTCGVAEVKLKYCPINKASWHLLRVNVHQQVFLEGSRVVVPGKHGCRRMILLVQMAEVLTRCRP